MEVNSDVPLRLASAARTLSELDEQVRQWTTDNPLACGVKIVASVPGTLELYGIPAEAPAEDWALALGHGLHDLRAALDHLAQVLARIEGDEPQYPKGVYFPASETKGDWKSKEKALSTVPRQILNRIKAVQPGWNDSVLAQGLRMLHRLDIEDKHYGMSRLQPIISRFSLDDIQNWPDGDRDAALWQSPLMRVECLESFPPDTVGLTGVTQVPVTPILELDGRFAVMLDVQVWLLNVIAAVVQFVTTGVEPDDLPSEPLWIGE